MATRMGAQIPVAPTTSVAICVCGLERTLLSMPVNRTFHANTVQPLRAAGHEVSIFITVVARWQARNSESIAAFRQRVSVAYPTAQLTLFDQRGLADAPDFNGSASCLGHTSNKMLASTLLQWLGVRDCYHSVQEAERVRAAPYTWLLKTRTDIVYSAPPPVLPLGLLSDKFVYVPAAGMDVAYESQCRSDHMFLCPRALCRPYFELPELWESEHCVLEPTGGNGSTAYVQELPRGHHAPTESYVLPRITGSVGPSTAQNYFFWRYSERICSHSNPPPCCCGLLREIDWPIAISRGDARSGIIQCEFRLLWMRHSQSVNHTADRLVGPCLDLEQEWQRLSRHRMECKRCFRSRRSTTSALSLQLGNEDSCPESKAAVLRRAEIASPSGGQGARARGFGSGGYGV